MDKESVDLKINRLIWFRCMKNKESLMEQEWDKEALRLSEPQKEHLTGEFVDLP